MARAIESKARNDADANNYSPPLVEGKSYWDMVCKQMESVVYMIQYQKRLARNERKKQ